METKQLRCTLVGGSLVGKTTLLRRLAGASGTELIEHPRAGVIYAGDGCSVVNSPETPVYVSLRDTSYALRFIDTVCDERYDRLRPLSYPGTDIFVLCFSLGDRASLSELSSRWAEEVRCYQKQRPWLVVGLWTFEYRKHGGNERPDVSIEQVNRTLASLRARNRHDVEYVACDAWYDKSVQPVLNIMARMAGKTRADGKCSVM